MGNGAKTASHEESKKPSFLAKSWRAVKDFVKGTLYMLPLTIITSGAALGLSLLIDQATGGMVNPMKVAGEDFIGRWLGTGAILALVGGGGMKVYQGWGKPLDGKKKRKQRRNKERKKSLLLGMDVNLPGLPIHPRWQGMQG